MRGATARLLEVCALLRMPSGPRAALKTLTSIDDSIKHPTESISLAAVAALRAVGRAYFAPPAAGKDEKLVSRYAKPLATDPNAALRRGFTLALGALPAHQLQADLETAVRALIAASKMEDNVELRDPEVRRPAHSVGLVGLLGVLVRWACWACWACWVCWVSGADHPSSGLLAPCCGVIGGSTSTTPCPPPPCAPTRTRRHGGTRCEPSCSSRRP